MQVEYRPGVELPRPLAIVAFPTTGLVGIIAAQYLVEKLDLPLVGGLRSHKLPPAVLVRNGRWEPPVAFYGRPMACGPSQGCGSLLLVTSCVPIEGEAFWMAADALLKFFSAQGVELVLVLESHTVEETEEQEQVYTLSTGLRADGVARALNLPPLPDGLIGGVSGAMLVEGQRHGQNVLLLTAEAHEGHPDARGGAYLVKILSDYFVRAQIDLDPLVQQAVRIENNIRKTQWKRAHELASAMYH